MRRDRRSSITAFVVTAAVAALGACGQEPADEGTPPDTLAGNGVEVTRVTLGTERATGGEGVFFGPEDELFARVETSGHQAGTLVVDWKTEDGRVLGQSSRSIDPDGETVTEFHLASPERWPEGVYELEVWLDGSLAATRSFSVQTGE